MSLHIDDGGGKGPSRSRSRDRRLSASERRGYGDGRESNYIYPEDDLDDLYARPGEPQTSGALPYPVEGGGHYSMLPGDKNLYGYDYDDSRPRSYPDAPPTQAPVQHVTRDRLDNKPPGAFPDDNRREQDREQDREPYIRHAEGRRGDQEDKLKFLPQKYSRNYATNQKGKEKESYNKKDKYEADLAYGKPPVPPRPKAGTDDLAYGEAAGISSAASQTMVAYAPPLPEDPMYSDHHHRQSVHGHYNPKEPEGRSRARSVGEDHHRQYGLRQSKENLSYPDAYHGSTAAIATATAAAISTNSYQVVTVEPRTRTRDRSSGPRANSDLLAVDSASSRKHEKSRDKSRTRDKSQTRSRSRSRSRLHSRHRSHSRSHRREKSDTLTVDHHHHHSHHRQKSRHRSPSKEHHSRRRDRSLQPPSERMSALSLGSGLAVGMAGAGLAAQAPPSPMLESYYGTYQDCSPMPSPLLLPSKSQVEGIGVGGSALEPLSPPGSDNEAGDPKRRGRHARFHDSQDITTRLVRALGGTRRPDTAPLIEILPTLTHHQVMNLRADYKHIVKTGSENKGVNIAKHIRVRLKDEDPLLMKACYATALGMWESEAYWANFWYQGDKTRRELLIESLMSRTNGEIHLIKESFTDKKYDNNLVKCIKSELKEDKFKKAVLMVLDERRMEEYDHEGYLLPVDYALVDQDVADLRHVVRSEKGGETAMISIVVLRSDSHLRAILQEYEQRFHSNFARDALKRSGNLVGELLAHILNGVINRPVRDALLLHHAITASRKDNLRHELLISRLVRYHWDGDHMRAVKQAYRDRYGKGLKEAVTEATSGRWGEFCRELCIARTPDEVRSFDKVQQ